VHAVLFLIRENIMQKMTGVVISLLVVLALLVVACAAPVAAPAGEAAATAEPAAESEAAAGEPFRIAVVMPSSKEDIAWSQAMYTSLVAVQTEMGGESALQIAVSENMFQTK
jgi:basic membrane lipoprotein Med (substrate-binding protein (PBP1-ABC) superfamily)